MDSVNRENIGLWILTVAQECLTAIISGHPDYLWSFSIFTHKLHCPNTMNCIVHRLASKVRVFSCGCYSDNMPNTRALFNTGVYVGSSQMTRFHATRFLALCVALDELLHTFSLSFCCCCCDMKCFSQLSRFSAGNAKKPIWRNALFAYRWRPTRNVDE